MLKNIRLLYVHNFLTDFRFQTAFMVIYFRQILGSYAAAMSILAVESLTSALMDIPTGALSDRLGRKVTLALGSASAATSVACYAMAHNGYLLVVGAGLSGLSMCLFNGNNNALLFETLKAQGMESAFHHYQGRTGSMFQLALGVSALCSSFMTSQGLRFIFVIGIFPQVVAFAVSFLFRELRTHQPSKHSSFAHFKVALKQVWCNPRLRLLVVGQAISYGAGESAFNFRNAFINSLWPTWALGIYRSVNNAGGFLGYWFSGRLIDRIPAPYMLALAETYWFVTQMIAVFIANTVSPLVFMTGATLFGPFNVARDQLLQAEFADEQRATMGSVASFAGSLFFAVMAIVIGTISDHFGLAAGMAFGVAVSACSLPIYVRLFRKYF